MSMSRWVYYVVIYHFTNNQYDRYLLTAADVGDAEAQVLLANGGGWRAHHSEMVCSTTDHPFFKRL